MDPPKPSYTLLRIKRKATDQPLSSLVIETTPIEGRIKRRRDVSGRPKGVFRLAETVDEDWKAKGEEAETLRLRIEGLLQGGGSSGFTAPGLGTGLEDGTGLSPEGVMGDEGTEPGAGHSGPMSLTLASTEERPSASPSTSTTSTIPAAKPSAYQFRVIPPARQQPIYNFPPRVLTAGEPETTAAPLEFIDAQAVSSSSVPSTSKAGKDRAEEKEMEAFLPMLQEYLSLQEKEAKRKEEEERYVYDLYYRDLRPSLSSAPLGLGLGDGVTIGSLLGYNDGSPTSSPETSEPEDEADEDSNDEDYYRNDYPEDEDADEDMRGFHDAFEGEGEGEEEEYEESDEGGYGSDEREGGNWDYR